VAVGQEQRHLPSRSELLRLFLAEKHDPAPFYRALAERSVAELAFDVDGALVLDLGCGSGAFSRALDAAGARAVAVDVDLAELAASPHPPRRTAVADARRLPFPDAAFDGVVCSNVLEHTPAAAALFDEIERVLRPGGWAWVSWTNWYSPWGGHEIVPLHYLGPRLGLAVWRRLKGEPRKNVPFVGLWPTYVGRTLAMVRARPGLRLLDALPRYYPSQRWIVKVPVLREVATWNCLLLLERTSTTTPAR
jgi:SAM-dependent methyltransferase